MVDKKTVSDIDSSSKNNDNLDEVQIVTEVSPTEVTPDVSSLTTIILGENKMADVDTTILQSEHADIRREAAQYSADIRQENAKNFADARYATATGVSDIRREAAEHTCETVAAIDSAKDAVKDQSTAYFIASTNAATSAATDLASLKVLTDANSARISSEMALGIERAAAATALESAKLGAAIALGQSLLGKDLMLDGQKTRDLINDHKYHDMNRVLVERNTELVEERHERHRLRDRADQFQSQGQWAAVQSQLQAFQSQLQTATQGTVNFGTMSGNAGRNTSTNNVA